MRTGKAGVAGLVVAVTALLAVACGAAPTATPTPTARLLPWTAAPWPTPASNSNNEYATADWVFDPWSSSEEDGKGDFEAVHTSMRKRFDYSSTPLVEHPEVFDSRSAADEHLSDAATTDYDEPGEEQDICGAFAFLNGEEVVVAGYAAYLVEYLTANSDWGDCQLWGALRLFVVVGDHLFEVGVQAVMEDWAAFKPRARDIAFALPASLPQDAPPPPVLPQLQCLAEVGMVVTDVRGEVDTNWWLPETELRHSITCSVPVRLQTVIRPSCLSWCCWT